MAELMFKGIQFKESLAGYDFIDIDSYNANGEVIMDTILTRDDIPVLLTCLYECYTRSNLDIRIFIYAIFRKLKLLGASDKFLIKLVKFVSLRLRPRNNAMLYFHSIGAIIDNRFMSTSCGYKKRCIKLFLKICQENRNISGVYSKFCHIFRRFPNSPITKIMLGDPRIYSSPDMVDYIMRNILIKIANRLTVKKIIRNAMVGDLLMNFTIRHPYGECSISHVKLAIKIQMRYNGSKMEDGYMIPRDYKTRYYTTNHPNKDIGEIFSFSPAGLAANEEFFIQCRKHHNIITQDAIRIYKTSQQILSGYIYRNLSKMARYYV